MAVTVTVGPPIISINHGSTFLVSEFDGSITDASDQGLYSRDTRYLSRYQLYIDGEPWTLLNSGAVAYYTSRTYLVNPQVLTEHGKIEAGTLGLVLGRTIGEALHEDIDIRNYSSQRGSRISRSVNYGSAGRRSTFVFGEKVPLPGTKCSPCRAAYKSERVTHFERKADRRLTVARGV